VEYDDHYLFTNSHQVYPAILKFDIVINLVEKDFSLAYTLGIYISERKVRVMVMHIENFTKPL
jgi:hypothetical protein